MIYEPLELMGRLAALVHPPGFNITGFYGIFAPAASLRPRVIPEAEASSPPRHPCCQSGVEAPATDPGKIKNKGDCQPRNHTWATLMKRVLEVDVLSRPRCGGRLRILAAIEEMVLVQNWFEERKRLCPTGGNWEESHRRPLYFCSPDSDFDLDPHFQGATRTNTKSRTKSRSTSRC